MIEGSMRIGMAGASEANTRFAAYLAERGEQFENDQLGAITYAGATEELAAAVDGMTTENTIETAVSASTIIYVASFQLVNTGSNPKYRAPREPPNTAS